MEKFQVTADMNIEEEKTFRQNEIQRHRITITGRENLIELARMSDDRYTINNMRGEHISYEETRVQELMQELKILERGYISPKVEKLAQKMYQKGRKGAILKNAGDYIYQSWIEVAQKKLTT